MTALHTLPELELTMSPIHYVFDHFQGW